MSNWLSTLHGYFLEQQPFVIATVTAYSGSSPDSPGAALFYSSVNTCRSIHSEDRYVEMLNTAKELLAEPLHYRTARLPLGKVAGTENGFCEVIYERFDAQSYPDWLTQLRRYRADGINCTLVREFDLTSPGGPVTTQVLTTENRSSAHTAADLNGQHQNDACSTRSEGDSLFFQRTIQNKNIQLTLIGAHPVAQEISKQVETLPVTLNRIADVQQANGAIAPGDVVVIMTTDHDIDYQLCEFALTADAEFAGCLGSEKKAALFKERLLQSGISPAQLKRFHMPVGMAQIKGKQTSVVAASVVAQILAQHQW